MRGGMRGGAGILGGTGPEGSGLAYRWARAGEEIIIGSRDAQRAAMDEPEGPGAGLLLEGIVLRLQADLRWLEACERAWTGRKE